jgi:PKD repeat protein
VYQKAGVYTVILNVTDATGHVASASNTVAVTSPLSASFTYSPSNPAPLSNVQFTATATGGTAPYSYSWNFGDGTTGTGASASHSYLLPGTYKVTLTVVDANGLTTTASTTVTVAISLVL